MAFTPSLQHPAFRSLIIFHKRPIVRAYETLSLMLLTTAFFAFVFIRPTAARILSLLDQIKSEQQLNQVLLQKTNNINSAISLYSTLSSQLTILDEILPQAPSTADFLAKVDNLAQTRQLNISSVTFDQYNLFGNSNIDTNNSGANSFPSSTGSYTFTIIASGPFSNLEGFIEDLESLRRIVNLTSLTFAQTTAGSGSSLNLTAVGTIASAQVSKLAASPQ